MAQFAKAWSKYLDVNHREALHIALCTLTDQFFEDNLESEENVFFEYLPCRYVSFYTPVFVRRFYVAFLTVGYKLAMQQHSDTLIACTAEEIALYILIQEASEILENQGIEPDFDTFEDLIYQDVDFEFLYESNSDWIDSSKIRDKLAIANLHPTEWFKTFDNASMPVHPYCQDEETD
jgi:hypothetical protein